MQVQQIYALMNTITEEITGDSAVVREDLSNVVDIGVAVFGATSVDNYVKSLVDHIGRVIFVNRPYMGSAPSVLMDGWEFGSVLQKIQCELPIASKNDDWDLTNTSSYDPYVYTAPTVTAKFFNSKVTFEIDISFTEMQVKESFSSAEQLNGFISMIYTAVDKAMTLRVDALVMRTINNFIAHTLYNEYPDPTGVGATTPYGGASTIKAVNLLKLYNTAFTETLTAADALTDPEFIRFASMQIGLYQDRLSKMSQLFNIGEKERFTPSDMLHLILLSEFEKSSTAYLESDTYHNNLVALPQHETVPYWQGSGTGYALTSTSKIHTEIIDPADSTKTIEVECGGILGVMFDRDALAVTNYNRRVTSIFNPKGEFFNNFYKMDAGYFNDFNENFVVFFIA